jgi:hypothetical protein
MGRITLRAVGGAALAVVIATLALAGCGGAPNDTDRTRSTSAPVHRTHSYRGVGSQIIGPLTLAMGADAAWTSTGGLFMLIAVNAPASAQLIVSREARGNDYVPAGSYVLKVGTLPASKWTLRFRER